MDIKKKIRSIPDWPVKGVIFRDTTALLHDPEAFRETCDIFYNRYKDMNIDKIVIIDARGFLFGTVLAYKLNKPSVPVRKKGKLPPNTISEEYTLEYGSNTIEIAENAINPGERVVIIDDLIATGGTVNAAANLIEKLGGKVVECGFVIELPDLKGREKIKKHDMFAIAEFEGE